MADYCFVNTSSYVWHKFVSMYLWYWSDRVDALWEVVWEPYRHLHINIDIVFLRYHSHSYLLTKIRQKNIFILFLGKDVYRCQTCSIKVPIFVSLSHFLEEHNAILKLFNFDEISCFLPKMKCEKVLLPFNESSFLTLSFFAYLFSSSS